MERTGSFHLQYGTYIHAACLAAHANQNGDGFRQKDLRFFLELLLNWMETTYQDRQINIKNTQIQRILQQYVADGLIKQATHKKKPHYSFTTHGLLEITTRLVDLSRLNDDQDFFFLFHFVSLYSSKMAELLMAQSHVPKSLMLEVQHLLNPANILKRRIEELELKIAKLKIRMQEAEQMSKLGNQLFKKGRKLSEIVEQVESKFPYQLNNQKRMQDLFKDLSADIQFIEITDAPNYRKETLWEPLHQYYQASLKQTKSLLVTL